MWAAVLVPMFLRRHEASEQRSADRFHTAMRVLARRPAGQGPSGYDSHTWPDGTSEPAHAVEPTVAAVERRGTHRRDRAVPVVARRRRLLLAVLAAVAASAGAALLLTPWFWGLHIAADVALLGVATHLRLETVRSRTRARRRAREVHRVREARPGPTSAAPAPVRVPFVPPVVSVRSEPVHVPEQATDESTRRATGTEGRRTPRPAPGTPWQPVPVPLPTYLVAPAVRPTPAPRSGAPARSGSGWVEAQQGRSPARQTAGDDAAAAGPAGRRRAVNS